MNLRTVYEWGPPAQALKAFTAESAEIAEIILAFLCVLCVLRGRWVARNYFFSAFATFGLAGVLAFFTTVFFSPAVFLTAGLRIFLGFSGTIGSGATLRVGSTNALAGSTLDYESSSGWLVFDNSLSAATFGGIEGDGALTLITNHGVSPCHAIALTVGNNNSDTTYSGVLSGAGGSLMKMGSGTLTLS